MPAWRGVEIFLVAGAAFAWTAYCLFFFVFMGTPPISNGTLEFALRLTIIGGWLAGMAVAAVAIWGLRRSTFDETPRPLRVRVALGSLVAITVFVIAMYWVEMPILLTFFWGPLVGSGLLVTGWASSERMRFRLKQAVAGWVIGLAGVAVIWLVLPPGTLQDRFWLLVAAVNVAAATWWAWPLLLARARARSVAG